MTEQITDESLDDFEQLTQYDIRSFFSDYIDFVNNQYPKIGNYFSNISDISPTESFNALNNLLKEQKKITDIIILNAPSLGNYVYWAITEYVEEIGNRKAANNASKWLRSAITKDGYKQNIITTITAKQNQSLEDIENDTLSSNDPDEWVDTALQNEIREEDYTLDGGYLIKVIYKNNSSLFINGIVDNIDTADKTYGLDINRNIRFINDDLEILSYKDTMQQSAEILASLSKGDDPAFRDRGLNMKGIIGGNLASLSYPTIFRQLAANFATDDSFKSFSVIDIKKEQDAIFLQYQIETKAGDFFSDYIRV